MYDSNKAYSGIGTIVLWAAAILVALGLILAAFLIYWSVK